ncbi:unnamed protein product [Angiostrongylus costaricensis]|uniref:Uncharacterized protein n=1 Tax=Angiostrongylus costaricensis TaxID=334426 RepID=A0A0R3Q0Q8_ANGCS|nr:unnamed protein product [Angiostrongylus costaricensis]
MFIAALAVLVCTIYAQYPPPPPYPPKPSPPYDGNSAASMSASSFSSSYYPKPPYGPTYYPEYSPVHDYVEEYCDYCPRVKLSCKNSEGCFKPKVNYLKHRCKAIVTCDSLDHDEDVVKLVTNKENVLSEGLGISKLIQCRHGRWTAKDIHDDLVRFRGLSCLTAFVTE